MRRRVLVPLLVLAAPAVAQAGTGGAEAGPAPVASATAGNLSISTRASSLVGRSKTFTGTAAKGRTVTIERFDEIARTWTSITSTTAADDGSFTARWKADRPGAAHLRARVEGRGAAASAAAAEIDITLYRANKATYYGPGFYGNKTACGRTMTKHLLGVAHTSLPCGTQVTFLYKGRTITVPVVDRGPFTDGVKWDLTSAAAESLGFAATGTLGALVQADSR